MKPLHLITLSALIAVSGIAAAEDLKATMQPIYTKFAASQKAKDIKALRAMAKTYFTNDFVNVQKSGKKETAAQMLAQFESTVKMIGPVSVCTAKVLNVASRGSNADVSVANHIELTIPGPDGKQHKMVNEEQTLDTWVKVGNTWKMKQIKTVKETTLIDGKQVPAG